MNVRVTIKLSDGSEAVVFDENVDSEIQLEMLVNILKSAFNTEKLMERFLEQMGVSSEA